MLQAKESEQITLVEGLKLLGQHLPPAEAKRRLEEAFVHKAIRSSPIYAFSYEGAEIHWATGAVKISRVTHPFQPTFSRSEFLKYFFEEIASENPATSSAPARGPAVDREIDELFAEYDELVADVMRSNHQFFSGNLRRWLELLDRAHYFARPILQQLEAAVHFEAWYEPYRIGAFTGLIKPVEWPQEARKRLGLQLLLLRQFANGGLNAEEFAFTVMRSGRHASDGISAIASQIFLPMSRELKRFLKQDVERYLRTETERFVGLESLIPSSDRYVTLDHNGATYIQAIEAISKVEETVKQANDYQDAEDKEQRLAELSAGQRLLRSARVRVTAVVSVIGVSLLWLAQQFAGQLIGHVASVAWDMIVKLVNL